MPNRITEKLDINYKDFGCLLLCNWILKAGNAEPPSGVENTEFTPLWRHMHDLIYDGKGSVESRSQLRAAFWDLVAEISDEDLDAIIEEWK